MLRVVGGADLPARVGSVEDIIVIDMGVLYGVRYVKDLIALPDNGTINLRLN